MATGMYRSTMNQKTIIYLYKRLLLLILLSLQNEGVVAIIVSYELILLHHLLLTSYEYRYPMNS